MEPGVPPTRADDARSSAFSWNHTSNSHTGVVLIEKLATDKISSTEFRMGVPSSRPWGLFMPECPFCRASFQVQAQHANHESVNLVCKCGAKTKRVLQPKGVQKDRDADRHYIFPFPCNLKDKIKWTSKEEVLMGEWTSTPVTLRDPSPRQANFT